MAPFSFAGRAESSGRSANRAPRSAPQTPLLEVANDPTRLLVAFFQNPAGRKMLEPLVKQDWGTEALALGKRVAYLWCPEGILASKLAESVSRALGDAVTARNWATVLK